MRKKLLAVLCSVMCIAIGLFCCTALAPQQAQAAELKNLATDATALSVNTKAVAGSVVIGENGVSITNWNNTTEANPTAAIFVNDKVNSGDTVTATVNAYTAGTASGRLLLQMRFTQACADENIWHFTGKNAGKFINMDFQPGWLELSTRQNASYTVISTPASGNGGKNGELSGGYNIFDNTDHVITMSKVDTATGIAITVAVDGVAYVKDFAIDDLDLQGSYYFAMGMATWDVVTPTAGEHLDISSLTVSGVYEAEPVRPLANLAKDESKLSVNTKAVAGSVVIGENGVSITNWNNTTEANPTAAIFVNDKVNSGDTVTATVNAYTAGTASGRLLLQMRFTQACADENIWHFTGKNAGKFINMDFQSGWLELSTRQNASYTVISTPASGNGGKNGELSGGYNIFDNTDHVITMTKVDTATGIAITVAVDGVAYVKDFAIDDLDLQGSYYFAMGMATWDVVTPTAGEHLDISSLTVSGVYAEEEEEPVIRDFENLVFEGASVEYDGQAHNLAVTGAPEGATVTYDKADLVEVGTYVITATVAMEGYNTATLTATLTITAKQFVGLAFEDASVEYDGQAHNLAVTGAPEGATVTYDKTDLVEVGAYLITATVSMHGYETVTLTATLTITVPELRDFEGLVFEDATVEYDGQAHSLELVGAPEGATVEYDKKDLVEVGVYEIAVTVSMDGYNTKILTATLTIKEKLFENLVFEDATVEYDGQAHSLAVTGVPEGATVEYDKADLVEVGSYEITATVSMHGYKTETLTATLIIKEKEFENLVFEGATVEYDGQAHSLELVGAPEGATVEYDKADLVEAGTYEITVTVSMHGYKTETLTAVLVIAFPEVPTLEGIENVATNGDYFVASKIQNSASSMVVGENGIVLSDFAYEKAAAAFLTRKISATSTTVITFNANGAFTSEQLADAANYPSNGSIKLGISLIKSEDLYNNAYEYWRNAGALGKEIHLEMTSAGWASVKTYTLGKYESMMEASEKITIADGNANGPYYAGTKLLDGNDHTVTFVTEETEAGMIISIAIDGQWYVFEYELIGEEYKGEYYLAAGVDFNWVVTGASDPSQTVNIKSIQVSDYAPLPVLPDYEEIYDDAYNLVTNKYNFAYDENIMTITENGLSLNNVVAGVGNGFAITNGKVNEFDWAFKFNLNLYSNWDATGRPEDYSSVYDYSMLKFGFMVDAGLTPTGTHSSLKNMYYSFQIGKDYRAIPGSYDSKTCFLSFARHRGFSDSTEYNSYVNYKFGYDLVDGNDHWLVLKVRNVDDENGKGVSIELWLDGKCEISLVDYNTTVEDKGVEYDWDVYGRSGYLGMWTGSNNSEALAQNSSCLFKEMYVVSYDDDENGAYMPQAPKPDFLINRNYDFTADEVYYVGETIRLNLANAFIYEGEYKLTFTVVNNATGEAIGTVNEAGQWIYDPTEVEFVKIKIVANSEDGKTQFNIIDINIENPDVNVPDDSSSGSDSGSSAPADGCFAGVGASGMIFSLVAMAAFALIKKKNN